MTVNVGFVIPLGEKAEKPQPKIELPVAVRPTPVADCSTRDDDHDGINNCLDQCPGTIVGAKVDTQGCPISLDIKGVQFKFDSAELTSNAKIILDGVAASLIAYPQKMIWTFKDTPAAKAQTNIINIYRKNAHYPLRFI